MSTTVTPANRDSETENVPIVDLDRQRDPDGQPLNGQRLALARLLADGREWDLPALCDTVATATGSKPATVKKTIQRTPWLEIEGFGSGRRASRVRLAAGVLVIGSRTAPLPSPVPSTAAVAPPAEYAPLFATLAAPAEPPASPASEPPTTITGEPPSQPSASELDVIVIASMLANLRETVDELTTAIVRIDGDQTRAIAGLLETIRDTIGAAMRTAAREWAEQRQREMDVVRGELAESRHQTATLAADVRGLQTALADMRSPSATTPAPSATKRAPKPAAKSSAKSPAQRKPSKTKPPANAKQRPSKPKPQPKQKPPQKPKSKPKQKPPQKPESSADLSQRIAATVRRLAGADGWADNAAVRDALGCNASNWSRKVQRAIAAKLIQRRQKGAEFQLRAMGRSSSGA